MCGVVAVSLAGRADASAMRLAGAAIARLRHRGTDGQGVLGDDDSAVAMCRLRLRSRPGDRVPFRTDTPPNAYAFNGEVYAVTSATGAVRVPAGGLAEAEAVDQAGPCAVDGMYATVRRDPDGSMHAARDPLGIKPLYVRRHRTGVALASEVPALLDVFDRPALRPAAVAQFLLLGRVVDGGTFFEDIAPVRPGARLVVKEGRVESVAVTAAPAPPRGIPVTPADLRAAVAEAVDRVLITDRPLGLALSGGLDSSIIAVELARRGMTGLDTVSVLPRGNGDGVRTLDGLGLPGTAWRTWRHRYVEFGPQDLIDGLPSAVAALGEPTAMTSVPMYAALAARARASGIVALLLGEGADELFAGYRSYLDIAELPDAASFYLRAKRYALAGRLLRPEQRDAAAAALRAALPPQDRDGTAETVRRFEMTHSLEPLLRRADHLLMAESIEGRLPLLHGDVPALAADLPWDRLIRDGQTKVALREAYAGELPAHRGERKKPFRAPIASWWSTGSGGATVRDAITGHLDTLAAAGVRPDGVRHLAAAADRGDATAADLAFAVLALGTWLTWLAAR
ncbi:asparagine synthetase B family protein [Mangrovihabitans endophyticus]|uniref:asparagine synthase (glutamine-hydrolyzing) n=1 Tax=Mangrovihabitans endophyticus TaxID=1751298 RepID=A0A8J3FN62_9ACTN|nr:asparagine synthase-related protein [Mangrovihabitans endophyticus]GGK78913.1 asparagine synthase [Mangrovihabitans endophyticus]